eukprot:gene18354-biopygen12300
MYAPTSKYSDEEIEGLYNQLEATLKNIPKKDILVVMGDWNAKIGPDAHVDWPRTAGKFGLGTRVSVTENANGNLLIKASKIQMRWTEYVQELYIYPISTDDNIIMTLEQESSGDTDEEPYIMTSAIEEALTSLKNGKASELLKNGGGCTIEILHKKKDDGREHG